MSDFRERVLIRTHRQGDGVGPYVASAVSGGRGIRVCGTTATPREELVEYLKTVITWERRGRPHV